MNPISDFLLFDPDAIVNVDLAFLRVSMVVLALVHTITWLLVILLLPFKLLSWLTTNKKK